MEQNLENYDFGLKYANVKNTDNAIKSHKCNQCDYASSNAGHLRTHLKAHNGEKSKKCNQCDYASSQAGNLKAHLKTHSGERSYKCNQCDYASSNTSHLIKQIKTIFPKNINQRISKTTVGGGRKRQRARATQPKNINYRHWPAGKH